MKLQYGIARHDIVDILVCYAIKQQFALNNPHINDSNNSLGT